MSAQPRLPRTLFVIGSLNIGGAERHLARLVPSLAPAFEEVAVATLYDGGPLTQDLRAQGVAVFALTSLGGAQAPTSLIGKAREALRGAGRFVRLVREKRFEVLHAFLPHAYVFAGFLRPFVRRPTTLLLSRRSRNHYQKRSPYFWLLERILHPTCHAFLGNGKTVIRDLLAEGVPAAKIGLIYNGIRVPTLGGERALKRSELGLGEGSLGVVQVANFIPYKGHLELIEAFASVLKRSKVPLQLILIGRKDSGYPAALAHARGLGVEGKITVLDSVLDVTPYLAACDIGVLASHEEGFSNALLEYAAAGLPVIATDVGAARELLLDGEQPIGLLCPPRDPGALAETLLKLVQDPTARRELGARGRERALKTFSQEATVEAYLSWYRKVLAR